jgi:hypothetical protein
MTEQWKPVLGYESAYEVSSLGRVRSLPREVIRNDHKLTINGKIRALKIDEHGRPCVSLWVNGQERTRKVCQLVAESFIGPRPKGLVVCHNDGNPANNIPDNLRWDTLRSNRLDDIKHGKNSMINKTHCIRNHPLSGDNLCPSGLIQGKRVCLACRTVRNKARSTGVTKS